MKMRDFAEIVKKSQIAGNNMKRIIYQLLQALGAKEACGESAMGRSDRISNQSPSDSTIQTWLSGNGSKPGVSRYFPNLKVENEERAHDYLRKTPNENQWRKLRDLFKEWHNDNQNDEEEFYINTETDDFITFSTSFWRQFVSFFDSLRMWDDAEELYPETESSRKKTKDNIVNKMVGVFKESFMQYRVYEFIPKEINIIFDSLYIYGNVSTCDSKQKFKKVYFKWFPNHEHFVFCEAIHRKCHWKLKIPGECLFFKFDESFDYDMMPTNTWMKVKIKCASADPNVSEDAQYDDGTLSWEESQGEIIFINIDFPVDEEKPIIKDCYLFIDEMLGLDSSIEKFIMVITEKILNKYEGVASDCESGPLYNDIKQYARLLKKFKKNLTKFRNLQKEKSEYLSNQSFRKTFEMYSAFSNFEALPKPTFPFSEAYLDPDEADRVILRLRHCHENLVELYTEIFSHEENNTV